MLFTTSSHFSTNFPFSDPDEIIEVTDEQLLHHIFTNNLDLLRKVDFARRNLNFLIEHDDTDLDDKVTPLAAASFLGRVEIVNMILQNPMVDIDMPTQSTGLTPLTSACCSGHYLVVKTLVENGADVNKKTGLDYSPLYY